MKAKISVVMSCYNSERWVEGSVESVLAQTFGDFEFIVIDDGSTDGTCGIIKRYANKDPRIKIITKANTGLADSLNVGIDQAEGEWIARIDADDLCMPDRLEKQLKFVSTDPDVVLLGSGSIMVDERGNFVRQYVYPGAHRELVKNLEYDKRFFSHSSAFFNKHACEKVGRYNPLFRRAQDRDLWLRLSEVGALASLPEPLIKLRIHQNSVSHGEPNIYGIAATVCYFLRKKGLPDPSSGSQDDRKNFIDWIEGAFYYKKTVNSAMALDRIREKWYANRRDPEFIKGLKLCVDLVKTGKSVSLLKRKFFGDRTARLLADKWSGEGRARGSL
jgi:glycosyltransferase involved in cell wall biosynthesis